MAQVQFAGHVGRWDGDHERLFGWVETRLAWIVGWLEKAVLLPPIVNALLGGMKIIGFWKI